MYDLSEFIKTLKQRVTMSYNGRHGRKGTLWEERFKSLLVDGSQGALSAVAAYIDLNAVRGGIVSDPKAYRFCGYGEALGGSRQARVGLAKVMRTLGGNADWEAVSQEYRKMLYTTGEARGVSETGQAGKPGFSADTVRDVLEDGGRLPLNQLLRCRVRYFTDGAILGSKTYIDDVVSRHRDRFSSRRRRGAHTMKGGHWGDLCIARRLRLEVITPPATG